MKNYKINVALVGRPNVGKSTLFNRLVGAKHAIVEDIPGVTRDYKEALASLSEDVVMNVIDTAGLDNASDQLAINMTKQTLAITSNVDVILFIIDGQTGITNIDMEFAKLIRKFGLKTIVVVNKLESNKYDHNFHEAHKLGFEDMIAISAAHGENMVELYRYLIDYSQNNDLTEEEEESKAELQLAIVGKPNAGKSTLLNALLGYARALTDNVAGTTRDSISHKIQYNERKIKIVDTAGIRKRANIQDNLEKMAVSEAMHALKFAQVAIILIDATHPLEKQDLFIIDQAIKEGRAIVMGINKIDLLSEKELQNLKDELSYQFSKKVHFVKKIPIVYLSAINKQNIHSLLNKAIEIFPKWSKRITTHKLNEWLRMAINESPIPLANDGRAIKIKYITQHKSRPPTFLLFVNRPEELKQHYVQYLQNSLSNYFDLAQIPIRIILRKQKNPYIN
jgi:GTP-binding protein